MTAEFLQAYVSVAALILAMIGLPILFVQIRELQRSVRSGAHAAIYEQAADFRSHLVQYPHLRRYFFEGREIAHDHEEYDRVVTIGEMFLNQLEHIAVMGDTFGRRNRESLDRYVRNALENSPILTRRLTENPAAYSHALGRFLPTRAKGGPA